MLEGRKYPRRERRFIRPAKALSLAGWLFFGGCGESSSPTASDMATVMDVPATDEQLEAFSVALNRWSAIHSGTPLDVDDMVRSIELVIVGALGSTSPGRKAYAGPGSYDSYANLELRDVQVIKGTLPDPSQNAYVEVPWPNNIELKGLVDATPVGARVIVLADHVKGALEEAQTLETEEGIDAVADVKTNLVSVPPYGLLVEGVDEQTHAPLLDLGAPLVVNGADALTNFEEAIAAIRVAAER